MNTLTISDVFQHYLAHHSADADLSIHGSDYYTPVIGANLKIWPFIDQPLCLGELLALWQNKKWWIDPHTHILHRQSLFATEQTEYIADYLLYDLNANGLLSTNTAKLWSITKHQTIEVSLNSTWLYYLTYHQLKRPRSFLPDHHAIELK